MKREIIVTMLTVIMFFFTLNGCSSSDAMNQQISEIQDEIDKQADEIQDEINKQASEMLNEINGKEQEYTEIESSTENEAENESELQTSENDTSKNKSEMDSQSKTTELFEQVYIPYANREKTFVFDSVKTFVNTLEYESEITDPTEDDLGEIKVIDTSGDYVYFCFTPINGIEMIMSVNYYHNETNSEVSLNNYSSDGSPQYDKFTTHKIGESNEDVSSTDEQRIFLFN